MKYFSVVLICIFVIHTSFGEYQCPVCDIDDCEKPQLQDCTEANGLTVSPTSSTQPSSQSTNPSSSSSVSTDSSSTSSSTSLSTDSSTSSSTDSSTASSTDSSTASSTDSSTASSTDSSTASSTDSSTASSTDSSTASSTDSSTASSTDSSTASSTDSSTASSTDSSTASSTDSSAALPPNPLNAPLKKKNNNPQNEIKRYIRSIVYHPRMQSKAADAPEYECLTLNYTKDGKSHTQMSCVKADNVVEICNYYNSTGVSDFECTNTTAKYNSAPSTGIVQSLIVAAILTVIVLITT